MDLGKSFHFQLLILGDHDLLEGQEIITKKYLSEDFIVALAANALDDAFF